MLLQAKTSVVQIRRISMFLDLPDPDLLVRGMDPDPDPSPFPINVLCGLKKCWTK
jgi:hypothetical protein